MGGRLSIAVAVACVLACASRAGLAAAGSSSPVRSCGTVEYTDMTVRVKVRGRASCRGARRVALEYADTAAGGEGCPADGGNTCPLRIGSFRCSAPTAGSLPLVLSCSSRRLNARIKGYKVDATG